MKAFVHNAYGPPSDLELAEVPTPVPADDEVLIRVKAVATNPADWHMITGKPYIARAQMGLSKPKTNLRGADLSGVIEQVGSDVEGFAIGDEVFGEIGGGFAQYTTAKPRHIVRKPENVSFAEAAAVPIAGLTALQALRDKGAVSAGDRVLVNGASGGVGTYAVQIAKAFGATVTGVCSTRNLDLVTSIGADDVVDYTERSYLDAGERYDVIIDAVGNHSPAKNRSVLTEDGTYVAVGNSAMGDVIGPITWILKIGVASAFRNQTLTAMLAKSTPEDLQTLADMLGDGTIRSVLDTGYAFEETREALTKQGGKHGRGKTVITVES